VSWWQSSILRPLLGLDRHYQLRLGSVMQAYRKLTLDWNLVGARYWADQPDDNDRQRRKQAEFLVWQSLGWSLIEGIGVLNAQVKANVEALLGQHPNSPHPKVEVRSEWYY